MKYYYTYTEFIKDLNSLSLPSFDALVAIARGGMTIAHFLAERYETREVYTINAISYENEKKLGKPKIFNIPDLKGKKRVILIDDISDSGETFIEVKKKLQEIYPNLEILTLAIFYKEKTALIPDIVLHKTDKWIVFFWDKEGQKFN